MLCFKDLEMGSREPDSAEYLYRPVQIPQLLLVKSLLVHTLLRWSCWWKWVCLAR